MEDEEFKGALAFIGILILGLLFFFGFLVVGIVLILIGLLVFLGFYLYVRLKLWWVKRHPPKELEGPEDYLG
ncbi:hypothetical protein [Thermococcus stetteri]|uniref:hypothetical protein n=1 Tax=Thermococcus stetteri TaxID=49900 RepID=UPI001AE49848|nr:hypothetical protein [Thermococcus stetteri]MBP1912592.1 uncharacterized SAM-binding protein YcdF (DUF218 family) [Thermococcus stetteri]